MDIQLKDFIKAVLSEITDGVTESQSELKSKGVIISPSISDGIKAENDGKIRTVSVVSFSVELIQSESDDTELSGGAKLYVFSAGANNKTGKSNAITSKVSFNIPVILPSVEVKEPTKIVTQTGLWML